MRITEDVKNEVHKVLKYCREGISCAICPYGYSFDCIAKLEHKVTELYVSEHPEIFNSKIAEKADKVELIRCKDCAYFEDLCLIRNSVVDINDYCSRAKKKG